MHYIMNSYGVWDEILYPYIKSEEHGSSIKMLAVTDELQWFRSGWIPIGHPFNISMEMPKTFGMKKVIHIVELSNKLGTSNQLQ